MVSVAPLDSDFGVEISGISARTQHVATMLRQAVLKHHLLVVRGRILKPHEQIAFARISGEPAIWGKKPQFPQFPAIHRVTNQPGEGHLDVGQYWHADGTFLKVAPAFSIWHVVRHPGEQGDTLFSNMHRAYDELPIDLKSRIENLQMISKTGAMHPCVKRHPVTGRKALYTSIRNTKYFSGLGERESGELLQRIDEHLGRPGGHYRHKWRVGDIIVGDNLSVAHKATVTDPSFPRDLHRVSIRGDAAFYNQMALNRVSDAHMT